MAYTYPVKWITSTMRGASAISGTTGSLIAAFDAFLLTGWGLTSAVSVTVEDGVGTAVFTAGTYFEDHAVVLIAGATPAALNGEARVLSHTSSSITFETDAADGAATGAITFKYAPVGGWKKAFSGTNLAVYRSTDVQSPGHCLRVDDTGTTAARVVGYESMMDVSTGTGPFPTGAQVSGGGYVVKSTTANSNSVTYALAADSRAILWAIEPATHNSTTLRISNVRGFGDMLSMAPGGDPWSTVLSCMTVSVGNSTEYGVLSGGTATNLTFGLVVCPRAFSGLGGAALHIAQPLSGSATAVSGNDPFLGAVPASVTGKLYLSRMFVRSQTAADGPRAFVPGVVFVPQNNLNALIAGHDKMWGSGEFAGRQLLAVCTGGNLSGTPTGIAFIDITGPWR